MKVIENYFGGSACGGVKDEEEQIKESRKVHERATEGQRRFRIYARN